MLHCVYPASPAILRNDAIASEAAAFTAEELSVELAAAGLGDVRSGFARPLPYLQAYWLPGAHGERNDPIGVGDEGLGRLARREAALLRWGFSDTPF